MIRHVWAGLAVAACAVMVASAPAAEQAGTQPGRGRAVRPGVIDPNARLRTPAQLKERAPDLYRARFDTTKGAFVIEVHRDWAPNGADRFYNLVKNGFYDGVRFFRVLDGFMAQFGMSGDPSVQRQWTNATIPDDPVKESNKRGYVTFAKSALPNSRTTQIFINFVDNTNLDKDGFAPFDQVVTGMDVVDTLHTGYGRQNVPDQFQITKEGEAYLKREYPLLDMVKTATIER
jgi:peptidyl-prolyl cis-trans isomerase A (cyclophilin A)